MLPSGGPAPPQFLAAAAAAGMTPQQFLEKTRANTAAATEAYMAKTKAEEAAFEAKRARK
jgi:hypothetical protein